MRISNIAGALALCVAVPLTAIAQDTGRASPDSIRPLDTEPSIPVETPVLGPTGADRSTGRAATDPNTPVSSEVGDRETDAAAAGARSVGDQAIGVQPSSDPAAWSGAAGRPENASGLPVRAAPERTLRAHWHVYIAFAIVWALMFGYVVSLGRRFARLEAELERLGG